MRCGLVTQAGQAHARPRGFGGLEGAPAATRVIGYQRWRPLVSATGRPVDIPHREHLAALVLRPPLEVAQARRSGGPWCARTAYGQSMEINLDLGLVGAEFDESSVTVDDDMSISGVLHLTGAVDEEWLAAFGQSAPLGGALDVGGRERAPLRPASPPGGCGLSRNASESDQQGQRERGGPAPQAGDGRVPRSGRRARAYRQAMDALSGLFSRRLSTLEASSS